MYKIMLVEDEPPILRNLEKKFDGLLGKFEVSYMASTAEEALENVSKIKPDIIVSDMKLTGKSGVWLFQQVKTNYPHIICVALSGYKAFDYVRECLRLQVEDYLTKPIAFDELCTKFQSISIKLDKLNKDKMLNEIKYFLNNDIHSGGSSIFQRYHSLRLIMTQFGSLNIQQNMSLIIRNDEILQKFAALKKYLSKNMRYDYWDIEQNDTNSVLIVVAEKIDEKIKPDYFAMGAEMIDKLNEGLAITVMVSSQLAQHDNIHKAYSTIKRKLRENLVLGYSQVLSDENSVMRRNEDRLSLESIKANFVAKYVRNDVEGFILELKKFFSEIIENKIPQIEVQSIVIRIIQTCEVIINRNTDNRKKMEHIEDEISELFYEATTINNLYDDLCKLVIDYLFSSLNEVYEIKDDVADKIEKYLKDNYMHQITLPSIATIFGYTPQYLSRYFKTKKGDSPIKFLILLRIKKAKEIIKMNPSISFNKVSEMVGYEDTHYFGKLFKQFSGVTLTEYKDQFNKTLTQD